MVLWVTSESKGFSLYVFSFMKVLCFKLCVRVCICFIFFSFLSFVPPSFLLCPPPLLPTLSASLFLLVAHGSSANCRSFPLVTCLCTFVRSVVHVCASWLLNSLLLTWCFCQYWLSWYGSLILYLRQVVLGLQQVLCISWRFYTRYLIQKSAGILVGFVFLQPGSFLKRLSLLAYVIGFSHSLPLLFAHDQHLIHLYKFFLHLLKKKNGCFRPENNLLTHW